MTRAKLKGFEEPGLEGPFIAEDVSSRNYDEKAKEFCQRTVRGDGKIGFMISTENRTLRYGDVLVETLHEWGAWRTYFLRLGLRLKVASMDKLGYYQVPAQWPHLFAAGETPEVDYAAGNMFSADWHAAKAKERNYGTKAIREATVAAAKMKFPMRGKYPVTPESHLKKREPGIDVDQLMKDHAHDVESAPKGAK